LGKSNIGSKVGLQQRRLVIIFVQIIGILLQIWVILVLFVLFFQCHKK